MPHAYCIYQVLHSFPTFEKCLVGLHNFSTQKLSYTGFTALFKNIGPYPTLSHHCVQNKVTAVIITLINFVFTETTLHVSMKWHYFVGFFPLKCDAFSKTFQSFLRHKSASSSLFLQSASGFLYRFYCSFQNIGPYPTLSYHCNQNKITAIIVLFA